MLIYNFLLHLFKIQDRSVNISQTVQGLAKRYNILLLHEDSSCCNMYIKNCFLKYDLFVTCNLILSELLEGNDKYYTNFT